MASLERLKEGDLVAKVTRRGARADAPVKVTRARIARATKTILTLGDGTRWVRATGREFGSGKPSPIYDVTWIVAWDDELHGEARDP